MHTGHTILALVLELGVRYDASSRSSRTVTTGSLLECTPSNLLLYA